MEIESTKIQSTEKLQENNEPIMKNKFIVFNGNHPEAVREALLRRGNFIEVFAFDIYLL